MAGLSTAELACLGGDLEDCGDALGLLPSLLMIGTRKGGTTALSNVLREHPAILMPNCKAAMQARGMCVWDKEVRYFSRGIGQKLDMCWYRNLYRCEPSVEGAATGAHSPKTKRIGFDGSPDYLIMPEHAIEYMQARLGHRAKLVALLRNPADRFYSAYNMAMNEEREKEKSRQRNGEEPALVTYSKFAEELDRLLACAPECQNEKKVIRMFFHYGLYAKHLTPYVWHFGRDMIRQCIMSSTCIVSLARSLGSGLINEGGGPGLINNEPFCPSHIFVLPCLNK